MALNWKEIDLILQELDLEGSFIRQIHGPSYQSLVFELYRPGAQQNQKREGSTVGNSGNFRLFISLANPHCRLHGLTQKLENPPRPTRFTSFLRARIRNGRIVTADQPCGERIIRLVVAVGYENISLWIRLWTGASNIIVTDSSCTIIDTFYRRPKRGEVAGMLFKPPENPPENSLSESSASTKGKKRDRLAFKIRELPGQGSFNQRVEAFFVELEEKEEREYLRKRVIKTLKSEEAKIQLRLEKLRSQRDDFTDAQRFKELGDIIMSSIHTIKRGDRWLKAEDFFKNSARIEIELDPTLNPVQNAEYYYQRHRKSKTNLDRITKDIELLDKRLQEIRSDHDRISRENNLQILRREAKEVKKSDKTPDRKRAVPGLVFRSSIFTIIVGRTARENDTILRSHVRGNDYWFHSRDYPGAYVFIKAEKGKSIPLETMLDAGNLAIFYSGGKNSGQGDIYYTKIKYLRRAKGGKQGTVIPTSEKNLFIKLDTERIARLKKSRNLY